MLAPSGVNIRHQFGLVHFPKTSTKSNMSRTLALTLFHLRQESPYLACPRTQVPPLTSGGLSRKNRHSRRINPPTACPTVGGRDVRRVPPTPRPSSPLARRASPQVWTWNIWRNTPILQVGEEEERGHSAKLFETRSLSLEISLPADGEVCSPVPTVDCGKSKNSLRVYVHRGLHPSPSTTRHTAKWPSPIIRPPWPQGTLPLTLG